METPHIEVESQATELAAHADEILCDDMSGMFGTKSERVQQEILSEDQSEQNDHRMQTSTEKNDSDESNGGPVTVEGNDGEESKQKSQSVDEILTEVINTNKITQNAQAEQVPEEIIDPGDAAAIEQDGHEDSPRQEADISSDPDNAAPNSNNVEDVAEVSASSPGKGRENGVDKIFKALKEKISSHTDLSDGPPTNKVYEAIQKMTQSPADLPGQPESVGRPAPDTNSSLPEICAKDIMQTLVIWASPEDNLQQAITKMQQTNASYIMVGQNETLEGLVSKSDITKAMSPYLLPMFAKWRRPLDDATLKIRIRWIMSRPVHTIKPQASLATILEHMSRFRGRCLPVMDDEGNVQGMVTASDVFQTLLKNNSDTSSTYGACPKLVKQASSAEIT